MLIKNQQFKDASEMVLEEDFDDLEKTKEAFDKYYAEAWKNAKKAIRKNTLVINKKKKKDKE